MFLHAASIVPVFLWRPKAARPTQVGSSVLLRVAGRNCLLTAAHVTDLQQEGRLCIPGVSGATEFAGGIGFNPLEAGALRDDDPLDMAFLLPTVDQHSALPPEFIPLSTESIDVSSTVSAQDFCLVSGFPGSRAWVKHRNNELTSSCLQFVGIAVEPSRYADYGFNPEVNILIEYHLKLAIYPEGDRANPPSPRGMSGGGVFRIARDANGDPDSSVATLVGVMHKFKERKNVFVATRLQAILGLVAGHLRRLSLAGT